MLPCELAFNGIKTIESGLYSERTGVLREAAVKETSDKGMNGGSGF